jgi:hypothetical protein
MLFDFSIQASLPASLNASLHLTLHLSAPLAPTAPLLAAVLLASCVTVALWLGDGRHPAPRDSDPSCP